MRALIVVGSEAFERQRLVNFFTKVFTTRYQVA